MTTPGAADPEYPWVDLGSGVTYRRRDLDGQWVGIDYRHPNPATGQPCSGWIAFDVPAHDWLSAEAKWQVESWDPLTVSPSLLCRSCGHHGFVRAGRWVSA